MVARVRDLHGDDAGHAAQARCGAHVVRQVLIEVEGTTYDRETESNTLGTVQAIELAVSKRQVVGSDLEHWHRGLREGRLPVENRRARRDDAQRFKGFEQTSSGRKRGGGRGQGTAGTTEVRLRRGAGSCLAGDELVRELCLGSRQGGNGCHELRYLIC